MRKNPSFRPQAQNPAAALQAKFDQGLALHKQGNLSEAEHVYCEILQRQPHHFDALHLLGVTAVQTRRPEWGVKLIRKAIGLNPKVAIVHHNLGRALSDLEQFDEAIASYDKAIWPAPGSEYSELGVLMEPEVRHGEAEVHARIQA